MYTFAPSRIVIASCTFLVVPNIAHAYVDPGLGGQLFQLAYVIVFAGLAVVTLPFRAIGRAIRSWRFGRRLPPSAHGDH